MKPNPFDSLKNLTVPLFIILKIYWVNLGIIIYILIINHYFLFIFFPKS